MRAPALLIGLCLAYPALGAQQNDSACSGMTVPAAELSYVSRGFRGAHTGIDMMASYGSPIHAAAGGTIVFAGWYFAYGRIVDIRHSDGLITRYAHMSEFAPGIAPGEPVAAGALIGRVGMTGRAHGPHVHFEVRMNGRAVDPRPFLVRAACGERAAEPLEEAHAPEERHRRRR